ncbi:MAG: hypothetical protein PHS73_01190 [Candidatus Peribacteraceae bacterium]|nr:hypothetical protein [Candidatus Peribacteraceae bacterium]
MVIAYPSPAVTRYHEVFRTSACDLAVKSVVFTTVVRLAHVLVARYAAQFPDYPDVPHRVVGASPWFHQLIGSTFPAEAEDHLQGYCHSKGLQADEVLRSINCAVEAIAQRSIDVLEGRMSADHLEDVLHRQWEVDIRTAKECGDDVHCSGFQKP